MDMIKSMGVCLNGYAYVVADICVYAAIHVSVMAATLNHFIHMHTFNAFALTATNITNIRRKMVKSLHKIKTIMLVKLLYLYTYSDKLCTHVHTFKSTVSSERECMNGSVNKYK